jgi:Domain of unknown function (DUF4157)
MNSSQCFGSSVLLALSALLTACSSATRQNEQAGIAMTPTVRVVFATVDEGQRYARTKDDYSQRTGLLERQLKVRTTRHLSESEYLDELAADVRAWSDRERESITRAVASLRAPLARMQLPLPAQVTLVRMDGRVYGNRVAYTRGNAIYFPGGMVSEGTSIDNLRSLLAHELFHVASRQDRAWRDAMYAIVGFQPVPEVVIPPDLLARKITNPDAPRLDSAIRLSVSDRGLVWVVPLTQSKIADIGHLPPPSFLSVMDLVWLEVGRGEVLPQPIVLSDPPVLHGTDTVLVGLLEHIGRNTKYIVHAEEILASNFAQMMLTIEPPSPEIHARMRRVMDERASRGR